MEIDLSSETILVTGGVGRIGMSVSTLLLEVGATVVISDINEKKLADFEHQMSANFKNKIYAIPADITNKTNIGDANVDNLIVIDKVENNNNKIKFLSTKSLSLLSKILIK